MVLVKEGIRVFFIEEMFRFVTEGRLADYIFLRMTAISPISQALIM